MKDVDRDEWHGGNSASPTWGLAKLGWQWLTRVAWKLGGFQVGWQSDRAGHQQVSFGSINPGALRQQDPKEASDRLEEMPGRGQGANGCGGP